MVKLTNNFLHKIYQAQTMIEESMKKLIILFIPLYYATAAPLQLDLNYGINVCKDFSHCSLSTKNEISEVNLVKDEILSNNYVNFFSDEIQREVKIAGTRYHYKTMVTRIHAVETGKQRVDIEISVQLDPYICSKGTNPNKMWSKKFTHISKDKKYTYNTPGHFSTGYQYSPRFQFTLKK